MSIQADLVGFITTTTGTGSTIAVGGAVPDSGLRTPAQAQAHGEIPDGTVVPYTIVTGSGASVERETGTATVASSGTQLTGRTRVSSTTGSLISLVGTSTVMLGPNKTDFNAIGPVAVTGTPTAGQVPIASSPTAAAWGTPSGGGSYEVATFADLPSASSVTVGRVYTVLAAVCTGGIPGTLWKSDGTLWIPACRQVLYSPNAYVYGDSGGPTTQETLRSTIFATGVLAGCQHVYMAMATAFGVGNITHIIYYSNNGTFPGYSDSTRLAGLSVAATGLPVRGVAQGFSKISNTAWLSTASKYNQSAWQRNVGTAGGSPSTGLTLPNLLTTQYGIGFSTQMATGGTQIALAGVVIEVA
jgi:hypothetical protein